jgi:drug/metabolite transporter (DMT)-like permease
MESDADDSVRPADSTSSSTHTANAAVRGILLMVAGSAVLTLSDATTKWLTAGYPVGEIMSIRAFFTLIPILIFAWHAGGLHTLKITNIRMQSIRAACAVGSSFLFVAGLVHLPLADCIAIAFSGPLFVTALATPMLGEQVGWRRWSAVIVGFIGILIMLRPTGGAFQWYAILPLSAAACGAFRDIITRKVRMSASPVAVLAFMMAAVAVCGLFTLPFGWSTVSGQDTLLLILAGILVGTAQYLVIHAFYVAEASLIIPFKYLSLIWATLFGYVLWGDVPDSGIMLGAALVVGSGLYIMHREAKLARRGNTSG